MFYITGDTHGMTDWEKINTSNFPEQKYMSDYYDFLIVVGDFGGIWDGAEQDNYILKTYNQRNFTTLFIDGNHENHDLLDKYPVEEWNGGKVHKISDRVIHLMRGQVYNIFGTTFFTMGGAESTDKEYRKEGESWWARELPSDEEYEEALRNLEKVNFEVDVVLTHCAPEGYIGKNMSAVYNSDISRLLANNMAGVVDRSGNRLTKFLDELITEHGLKFRHWYFGHYHRDLDWENFSLVFSRIQSLKNNDLALFYVSRDDWEKESGEYLLCFEEGDSYVHFCDDDEIPVNVDPKYDFNLLVKVDISSDGFPQAEQVASYVLERLIKFDDDILMFECKDGHTYSYSCIAAINDYFKTNSNLFAGHKVKSLIWGPGNHTSRFDETYINKPVYEAMKKALIKEGEKWLK